MKKYFYKALDTPYATLAAITTLTASCSVALLTHSNPLATITSPEILLYGAADGATIFNHKEFWRRYILPNYIVIVATVIILLQGALDVFVSHSVKPGHTYGFIAGSILSLILIRKKKPAPRLNNTYTK